MGIAPGVLEKLFQPFTQADSSLSRSFEGVGLGLAVSRRLAEAMGGRILVNSTPGVGSTFTLRIPAEPPKSVAPGQSTHAAAADKPASPPVKKRILIVEDDRASALLARRMLSSLGFDCDHAPNGKQALDAFVPGKYDAILMDMQMPVMDGIEATRSIRELEKTAGDPGRVRIIALTANVMPGDRERCLAAGMDDFLAKPFSKNDLVQKLLATSSD